MEVFRGGGAGVQEVPGAGGFGFEDGPGKAVRPSGRALGGGGVGANSEEPLGWQHACELGGALGAATDVTGGRPRGGGGANVSAPRPVGLQAASGPARSTAPPPHGGLQAMTLGPPRRTTAPPSRAGPPRLGPHVPLREEGGRRAETRERGSRCRERMERERRMWMRERELGLEFFFLGLEVAAIYTVGICRGGW